MNSTIATLRWRRMGTALLIMGLCAGCTAGRYDDADPAVGTIAMSLGGRGESGNYYMLRDATFWVRGDDNDGGGLVYEQFWSTEDQAAAYDLRHEVPAGSYILSLLNGWRMQRIDARGRVTTVSATLLSARAQWVYVPDGATVNVVYEFEVGGERIVFDGQVGIRIRIHEHDGGVDEDGGVDCPLGDAGLPCR